MPSAPSRPLGPPPAPASPSTRPWRVASRRPVERWVIAFGDSHSRGLPATELFTNHRPEGVKSRFSQLSRSHTRPKRPAITRPASRQVSSHPSPPASCLPSPRPVPASRHVSPLSPPPAPPPLPPAVSLAPFCWHRPAGHRPLGAVGWAQSQRWSPTNAVCRLCFHVSGPSRLLSLRSSPSEFSPRGCCL